jgi:lysophospholipase L1-like esterase
MTVGRSAFWRTRAALVGCGLIAAGGLCGGVILELLLRRFAPQFGSCDIGIPDAELHAVLRPNHSTTCVTDGHTVTNVRTNELGFREAHIDPRDRDTCRVLVLGDSTTFGMGVDADHTIPATLERILNSDEANERKFEVINAGVPGYGTAQEWLLYRRWAEALRPDLVVLLFLTTNDVQDNLCEDARQVPCFSLDGNVLHSRSSESIAIRPGTTQAARQDDVLRSHLLLFFKTRMQDLLLRHRGLADAMATLAPRMLPRELPSTIVAWYDPRHQMIGWSLTEALLDALWADTQAAGIPLVLGMLPSRPQTTTGYAALIEAAYPDRPEIAAFRAEPNRPQRLLTTWAKHRGVVAVDPLAALQAAAETTVLNVPDGHFSAAAHTIIARELARAMHTCQPRE